MTSLVSSEWLCNRVGAWQGSCTSHDKSMHVHEGHLGTVIQDAAGVVLEYTMRGKLVHTAWLF